MLLFPTHAVSRLIVAQKIIGILKPLRSGTAADTMFLFSYKPGVSISNEPSI